MMYSCCHVLPAWRKAPEGREFFRSTEKWLSTESRSRTRAGLRVRRRLLRVGSCFQQGAVGTVVGVSVLGEDVEPERGWDG